MCNAAAYDSVTAASVQAAASVATAAKGGPAAAAAAARAAAQVTLHVCCLHFMCTLVPQLRHLPVRYIRFQFAPGTGLFSCAALPQAAALRHQAARTALLARDAAKMPQAATGGIREWV